MERCRNVATAANHVRQCDVEVLHSLQASGELLLMLLRQWWACCDNFTTDRMRDASQAQVAITVSQ